MFRDGPIDGVVVKPLSKFRDHRGWLMETFREDEMDPQVHPVMSYVSESHPGVTRGPHEHVDQTDLFAFVGPSTFRLYLWDARDGSATKGHRMVLDAGAEQPTSVIIPPGVVHAYTNTGDQQGWVLNFPNQLFKGEGKKQPVDEIRHEELADSPYVMD